MKAIAVGWAVLLAIFAPIIVGGLVAGFYGAGLVMMGYVVLMMLGLFTAVAALIGESIVDPHDPRMVRPEYPTNEDDA